MVMWCVAALSTQSLVSTRSESHKQINGAKRWPSRVFSSVIANVWLSAHLCGKDTTWDEAAMLKLADYFTVIYCIKRETEKNVQL